MSEWMQNPEDAGHFYIDYEGFRLSCQTYARFNAYVAEHCIDLQHAPETALIIHKDALGMEGLYPEDAFSLYIILHGDWRERGMREAADAGFESVLRFCVEHADELSTYTSYEPREVWHRYQTKKALEGAG